MASNKSSGQTAPKAKRPAKYDIATLTEVLSGRLRAVMICFSKSWGGLEKISADDAMELAGLGLQVSVLCLKDSPIHQHLAERGGIRLITIDYIPRDFFDFRLRRELQQLADSGFNLFHCHQTSILSSVVPWLFNRREVVLIASRHIMNDHNKRNPFHAFIYGRLDGLVVMSQALKQNVLNTHPVRDRQVKVIHYGLDFSRFDSSKVDPSLQRQEWGADSSSTVIGLVGRIDPAKGQETFIKAAAGLMKYVKDPEKVRFVIVGEETRGKDSGYLEVLREMTHQFRLDQNFVFSGFKENIPEVMKALDIFVMPSRQEAFGLVAIEAMSMGCPVIVSRGGSADEIVGEEEFGLLVRPDDAFDLQRQIRFLLDHPERREEMARAGCRHVQKFHDRRLRLQRTLELYERLLRRRKTSPLLMSQ